MNGNSKHPLTEKKIRPRGEALIIDPVMKNVNRCLQLMEELDLDLVKAPDTHVHADHITGLSELRDRTS